MSDFDDLDPAVASPDPEPAGAGEEVGKRGHATRPLRSLVSAVLVFLVLVLATAALKGGRDLAAVRAHERAIAADVAATEARIAALRRRIQRLQDDPATLERTAREQLGLVHPNDVVIVLPPPAPAPPAPAAVPATPRP
ncbi:MAG: septum formation initiator family protein [Thermoanaerobaculia bacterium]